MENPPQIDLTTFDALKEMVGADFIGELIDTYLSEAPTLIDQMRQALATGEADVFRRAAHSLKSNSASFGANTLANLARELEFMGRDRKLEGALEKVETLVQEYLQVEQILRSLV